MGKAVGIDLGTTNSVVAVLEGGEPTVIANAEEIEQHLLAQIKDELSDRYNTRPDHRTAPIRAITDQSGTETAA